MTVQQIESTLIKLPRMMRLKLAHFLLESVLNSDENEQLSFEYDVKSTEWLTLSEKSLAFWDNDEDAYYDNL